MNNQTNSKLKKRVLAVAVASCLSFSPWLVHAAGLGKITVLSGLGQPLRAEMEVNATRDELSGMAARLAPQDAFRQAGVDYAPVLTDLRFALEKRPDGKQVVKITSGKPVNEPFLDFLVELNWASGRLVREYTFLLDPPEVVVKSAGRPLSVVDAKVVQSIPGGTQAESLPVRSVPQANIKPTAPAAPTPPPVREAQPVAVEKTVSEPIADSGPSLQTKSGDTLGKIANATKHQGVSLEQMLVGLYQNNPEAFIGKNLNRLKSGVILSIPDKDAIEAISEAEAKKVLLAQSGDWNAYRQKLASAAAQAPAKPDSASQQTAGKITAKVEEKTLPAEQGKDQVKVSRSEINGKSAGKTGLSEEDQIARDRALKEAQERLLVLEKNVSELQKLLEMKNQKLAELQQQTVAKPAESKPAPKEPAKESVDQKPQEVAKSPTEEVKPVVAAKPVDVPKPPVKPMPEPEPEPEPSFVETLLADPLTLAGGGGILALLLGYSLYKRRKDAAPNAATAAAASALGQSSVFRTSTGGQSVDTTNVPQTADFSQTGPGTIDTDEVDPVAEADVYMAYGRDAQAEEILIEALQKDPQRIAIHAKLLEIYAGRNSLKQFETLATELYAQTAGKGPEWDKVAALGATIDPSNPLYSGADAIARSLTPDFDADATMVVTPERSTALKEEIAFELPQAANPATVDLNVVPDFEATLVQEKPAAEVIPEANDELTGLDFDLGAELTVEEPTLNEEIPEVVMPELAEVALPADEADGALDFDLGLPMPEESQPVQDSGAIDFDLDIAVEPVAETVQLIPEVNLPDEDLIALEELDPPVAVEEVPASVEPIELPPAMLSEEVAATEHIDADAEDALEFDMRLTDSTVLGQTPPMPSFDLSSINLDLTQNEEKSGEEAVADSANNVAVDESVREEINTKLDLAKAYEEMGDLEGARELLAEVAAEGPPDLAGEAKEILARIGS